MTGQLALALGGLALVDATSVGTLVLPLLMLVQPRVRAGGVLLYLATIAVFYFALGLALLVALDRLVALVAATEGNRAIDVVQLVVGVGLFAGSFWPDLPAVKRKREAGPAVGGRRATIRERLLGPSARPGVVVGVALAAGVVEAASMLPYLGAVGMVSSSVAPGPVKVAALAAYVAVMCLPALALLALRLGAGSRVEGPLTRAADWFDRKSGSALWWVMGVVGFLVASDDISRLASH